MALQVLSDSPTYENARFGDVPWLDATAVRNDASGGLTVFAVNRSGSEEINLEGRLSGFEDYALVEHTVLRNDDLRAANTRREPDAVVPAASKGAAAEKGALTAVLPRLSWNVLRLEKRRK